MDITTICSAIKKSLPVLKGARTSKVIDHSLVEQFQEKVTEELNKDATIYKWETEKKISGRAERDSVDIFGQATGQPNWVIEIDATRSDQVSQKLISRMALWGIKNPFQYMAVLYPDAHMKGKNACEKYLRYGNEIVKKINKKSCVIGIFVDPDKNSVEVLQFDERSHFAVNGKECKSMNEATAEAIKQYLSKHPVSFAQLSLCWGKYVNNTEGGSRYKNIWKKTTDGTHVYSFTQFRQYGFCSYWNEFERLCKKNKISIAKLKKIYKGAPGVPFEYQV